MTSLKNNNMNKLITTIMISFLLLNNKTTFAASPSPLPVSSATLEKAKELKEKVASKIAELKVISKRGVIGTIKSIKDTSLIINSNSKDITIETDAATNITLLQKGKRSSLKLTDLKADQKILVWGQYNNDQETLKAKQILVRVFSQTYTGTVKSIDKDNIILINDDGKEVKLGISPSTTIKIVGKNKTLSKSDIKTFSEGDFVHVYSTSDNALRILILPKSVLSSIASETPKPTASPKP
jgi:hypothetical protein